MGQIRTVATVGSLPAAASNTGWLIFVTAEELLYFSNGTAWATIVPVFQVENASFSGYNNQALVASNFYYNASNKYIANGYATLYSQSLGQHIWYNAPNNTSGAGAAITFTQAMTLDSSGNLGIGTSSPTSRLFVADPGTTLPTGITSGTGFSVGRADGLIGVSIGYLASNQSSYIQSKNFTNTDMLPLLLNPSGGNVGIGTSSPSVKFQTVQTIADWTGDFKNYTAGAYGLRVDLSGSSGVQAALQVYTATGNGIIVKNDGLVGIGTFSPANKLTVADNSASALFYGTQS